MPSSIQILTYIRHNPSLSPSEFYTYWRTKYAPIVAPWAQKYGMLSYRRIHTSGLITPLPSSSSSPKASIEELPRNPVHFDGIAMFEVRNLEEFRKAFEDPYFTDVVELDEWKLIDKEGLCKGIVVSYSGKLVTVIDGGLSKLREDDKKAKTLSPRTRISLPTTAKYKAGCRNPESVSSA